jgi:hypothetical protein
MTGLVPASTLSQHRAPFSGIANSGGQVTLGERHCEPIRQSRSAAFLLQQVAPQASNGKAHFYGRLISKHQLPEAHIS